MTVINRAAAILYNQRHRDREADEAIALLVAHWQSQRGLAVDGKLGPESLGSILDTLGEDPIETALLEGDHGDAADEDPIIAIDDDGWASGADVFRIASARSSSLHTRDTSGPSPVGVVWHWTATPAGTGWACARRIADPPVHGERAASWHVLITRAGEILHSVPFRRGAWHAGGATARRFSLRKDGWELGDSGRVGANALMIGIELENVGEVRPADGGFRGWPFDAGAPRIPDDEVVAFGVRHYQGFPEAQQVAARRLLRAVVREYGIARRAASWGHRDIDPTRKRDPGPVWCDEILPPILDRVFGG